MGPRSKLVLHRGRARYAQTGNSDDLQLSSWKRFLMRGYVLKRLLSPGQFDVTARRHAACFFANETVL